MYEVVGKRIMQVPAYVLLPDFVSLAGQTAVANQGACTRNWVGGATTHRRAICSSEAPDFEAPDISHAHQ